MSLSCFIPGTHAGQQLLPACALGVALSFATASPAQADLRICNETQSRIGLAIGYHDGQGWLTEGWFNLRSNTCETVIRGQLSAKYYYVYGVDYDRGGDWGGKSFMCTRDREFTIRGSDNCLARGYDRTGFFEIDIGDQRNWTVQLTDRNRSGGTPR